MSTCASCRHFTTTSRGEPHQHGRCRRFPPVYIPPSTIPIATERWEWPEVGADDACGEYDRLEFATAYKARA